MTTRAPNDWPEHLGYKTCVSKFLRKRRKGREVNGSVRHDLDFIKLVQGAVVTKKINRNYCDRFHHEKGSDNFLSTIALRIV